MPTETTTEIMNMTTDVPTDTTVDTVVEQAVKSSSSSTPVTIAAFGISALLGVGLAKLVSFGWNKWQEHKAAKATAKADQTKTTEAEVVSEETEK